MSEEFVEKLPDIFEEQEPGYYIINLGYVPKPKKIRDIFRQELHSQESSVNLYINSLKQDDLLITQETLLHAGSSSLVIYKNTNQKFTKIITSLAR